MTEKTLVIVSGYFSPLHCGHLDYLEAGASLGDRLIVIVNNDLQQKKKKGKVILPQQDRLRIVKALSIVDEACVAIDDDSSCLLYTSPSPRDRTRSRMPSSA